MADLAWPFVALVTVLLAYVAAMRLYRGWLHEMVQRRVSSVDVETVRADLGKLRADLTKRVEDLEQNDTTRNLRTVR